MARSTVGPLDFPRTNVPSIGETKDRAAAMSAFGDRASAAERPICARSGPPRRAFETSPIPHSSRSGPSPERLLRSCEDHRLNGHVGHKAATQLIHVRKFMELSVEVPPWFNPFFHFALTILNVTHPRPARSFSRPKAGQRKMENWVNLMRRKFVANC